MFPREFQAPGAAHGDGMSGVTAQKMA